jgi:CheY-like chemotaxis protein
MSENQLRILIVEGEKSVADELKMELEQYAELISVSGSAERGILRNTAFGYDFFVVNCGADGKQGAKFVENLKKSTELKSTAFLFTMQPYVKVDKELQKLGVRFDILRLPVDAVELHLRIQRILEMEMKTEAKIVEKEQVVEEVKKVKSVPGVRRVLLVEDNLLNQKVLGMFIAKLGFDYDVASNGQAAVNMCLEKKYSHILMDIYMPGMDGTEATEKIRENEKNGEHSARIIAISANESEDSIKRCYDSGMNDYLVKPFTIEVLKEKLV